MNAFCAADCRPGNAVAQHPPMRNRTTAADTLPSLTPRVATCATVEFRQVCVRAGEAARRPVEGLRIRDLRHSFASALANDGTPLYEIGTVLGRSQLSATTRYLHHAPQRLDETVSIAAQAWNLLPGAEVVEGAK
jgi:site-specific recombinase XerC